MENVSVLLPFYECGNEGSEKAYLGNIRARI